MLLPSLFLLGAWDASASGGRFTDAVPMISIDFLCHCDSFCEANTGHHRSIRFHRTRCWESSCHMGIRMHPCVPFAHGQWSVASAWIHLWEPEFPFHCRTMMMYIDVPCAFITGHRATEELFLSTTFCAIRPALTSRKGESEACKVSNCFEMGQTELNVLSNSHDSKLGRENYMINDWLAD